MIHTLRTDPKEYLPDILRLMHVAVCIFCSLITLDCMLMSYLSWGNALQDLNKYGPLGSPLSLGDYLSQYYFTEHLVLTLWVTAGFLVYIRANLRIKIRSFSPRSMVLLLMIAVIHGAFWIHANTIPLPVRPVSSGAEEAILRYHDFVNQTALPPVLYCVMYPLRCAFPPTK